METNIKVIGFSNKRINGKTLDSKGVDLDYDGKYLDVNAFDNNRQYYTRLDNHDIMHLLNIPSSQIPLEQRIMQFNVNRPVGKHKTSMSMHSMMNSHVMPAEIYYNQINKSNFAPTNRHMTNPRINVIAKYKTKRLSLTPRQKTRKLTYARVSSLKPISTSRHSKHSRYSKHSRKTKPVSSIRQTIY